jgi:hypothetical protein
MIAPLQRWPSQSEAQGSRCELLTRCPLAMATENDAQDAFYALVSLETDRDFANTRASTARQDATRAREQIEAFAAGRNLRIAGFYVENESGAKPANPELFRLLADSRPGDTLLSSRLTAVSTYRCRLEAPAKRAERA